MGKTDLYNNNRSIAAIISERFDSTEVIGCPSMLLNTAVISAVDSIYSTPLTRMTGLRTFAPEKNSFRTKGMTTHVANESTKRPWISTKYGACLLVREPGFL